MTPTGAATSISVDARWSRRLREDRRRATALQSRVQRQASATILQRALALGAGGVALTGSTVRGRRTRTSDLDFMIVGERPDASGIQEDVDVYAAGKETFWERILEGDDYIQWTLRFGCILHDDGILKAASSHIEEDGMRPSAQRKLAQARRGLDLAWLVLDSGDVDAAREQCRAALTTVARWILIANGEFPLCRNELPDQLLVLGCDEVATALHQIIHDEPESRELRSQLQLARELVSGRPGVSALG
jgi:predicted nucleotidyltransferase